MQLMEMNQRDTQIKGGLKYVHIHQHCLMELMLSHPNDCTVD